MAQNKKNISKKNLTSPKKQRYLRYTFGAALLTPITILFASYILVNILASLFNDEGVPIIFILILIFYGGLSILLMPFVILCGLVPDKKIAIISCILYPAGSYLIVFVFCAFTLLPMGYEFGYIIQTVLLLLLFFSTALIPLTPGYLLATGKKIVNTL